MFFSVYVNDDVIFEICHDILKEATASAGVRFKSYYDGLYLFVTRYTISSFIKRFNFSNCAEWARSALEDCHERLRCARDFLAKTQFSGAGIWRIWTLADMPLAWMLPYIGHHTKTLALCFWTYSFRWILNHQEPENTSKRSIGVGRDSNSGPLISSLTLYSLCRCAPLSLSLSLSLTIRVLTGLA